MYPHRHLVKFISMLILDCKYRKNFQESFIRMEEMMVWMANIFRIIQFSGNPEHRFAARLRYLCIQIGRMDCFKKNTEMKTGLVLEGGAMRGLFTCGVLDVLLESGVSFDGMIGVSAGAAFGCNFKSWQNGRALRYNLAYAVIFSVPNLLTTPLPTGSTSLTTRPSSAIRWSFISWLLT